MGILGDISNKIFKQNKKKILPGKTEYPNTNIDGRIPNVNNPSPKNLPKLPSQFYSQPSDLNESGKESSVVIALRKQLEELKHRPKKLANKIQSPITNKLRQQPVVIQRKKQIEIEIKSLGKKKMSQGWFKPKILQPGVAREIEELFMELRELANEDSQ